MPADRVIVIGAGIGGLAAALELAARGLQVTVLERHDRPGGKMRQVRVGEAAMDAGPTVFTMRWVFDELFARAGLQLSNRLSLQPVTTLARHAWEDGSRLDLHADRAHSADAIARFAGPAAGRAYLDFCARAARIYQALEQPFLRGQRPSPWALVRRSGLRGLPALMGISPFATLWHELGRHFRDPRLRQLFGRYATYCGSSPFQAPATLMLVAHVEQEGVWQVDGGMHAVACAVEQAAIEAGATFRYGAAVGGLIVAGDRVRGVHLASGERLDADAVLYNGDVAALADGRLGSGAVRAVARRPAAARSLSAITWNLLAQVEGDCPLLHHTVCFSPDYAAEFGALVHQRRLPARPTVYLCAQDRGSSHPAPAPGTPERLLCLVNAPADGDGAPLSEQELAQCERQTFEHLKRCGVAIHAQPAQMLRTTPTAFDALFPGTGGALYGPATHGWRASFQREGARSRLPGLYLAGGSVHPGAGVPTAALSGHLAASCLMADLSSSKRASTSPSPRAATPGGTSTR